MVGPEHEFFHKRTDDPNWNESGWFGFSVPERETSGGVYVHHRPNRSYVWAGLVLWDPSASDVYDCLWHDFAAFPLPLGKQEPGESKVFEFETDAGLRVRCPEPLKRYEFDYKSGGCEAELIYECFMDAHASGLAEGWDEWGHNHFDQAGRVTGYFDVEGERYEVDCLAARDRSWGPLRLGEMARGCYTWAIASEDHGFVSQSISQASPDADPVIGATEAVKKGWYRRDGETAGLVSGEHRIERGDDGSPVRVYVEARDEKGREMHAEARCVSALKFPVFGSQVFWNWSLAEWKIDGADGWGEEQDFFGGRAYRNFARSLERPQVEAS